MKNIAGDIIIYCLHMRLKNHNYMMYGSSDTEWDRHIFLSFWAIFYPFTTNNTQNQNFEKIKNTWRYYWFTTVYHKWQSYHVWFLRYGLPRTKFFVILHNFLPFYITPPTATKIELFKKKFKIRQEILSFYKYVP